MSQTGRRWMSLADFAVEFDITPEAARLWCIAGRVPGAFKTPGKRGRWKLPTDSVEVVRQQGTPPTAAQQDAAATGEPVLAAPERVAS